MGHSMIMGRKTYESIGRPLPGRTSIVITHQADYTAPGCLISPSFKVALELVEEGGETEVFVIGGAQVFTQALPYAQRMYLTLIQARYSCDVHFPIYDPVDWVVAATTDIDDDPNFPYPYSFVTLIRSSP